MGTLIPIMLWGLLNLYPSQSISCMDDAGNPVEWFIAYKLPNGHRFLYMKPGILTWTLSKLQIDRDGMLKNTFDAIHALENSNNSAYGVYNDQNPSADVSPSPTYGHMKGAIAFEFPDTGVWIIHSIPKLSSRAGQYAYPSSGETYAQHILCVTLKASAIDDVVKQLGISRPQFLVQRMSSSARQRYPMLALLLKNKRIDKSSWSTREFITRDGGLTMKHFSKSAKYGVELYAQLVAEVLRLGLYVETWRRKTMSPVQSTQKVYDVKYIRFPAHPVAFPYTKDHSKWASTIVPAEQPNDKLKWVCLGDINREKSQFNRGGGTMCINNPEIWKAFDGLNTDKQ